MGKKKLSLGIVQTHPTQFDGPLFRRIARKNEFDLTVYYTDPAKSLMDPEVGRSPGWSDDNSRGYGSYFSGKEIFGELRTMLKILEKRHDLVIFSGYRSFLYFIGPYLCRAFGTAAGLRSDNILCNEDSASLKWRLKRLILPFFFRIYTWGLPVGSLAAEYLKSFGFTSKNMSFFPYTVDADECRRQYEKSLPDAKAKKEKMGIMEGSFIILGIMKFVPREDPMTLLRAFEKISQEYPQTHLVLVGSGELENSIRDFITQNNLARVHLSGYVQYKDLAIYYGIADVFVHPAVTESWGVSVHESLACGVPVIASDAVGAAADLVLPANAGRAFRAGSAEELVSCLRAVMEDRGKLAEFSRNSERAIRGWSVDKAAQNLHESLIAVSGGKYMGGAS